MFLSTGFASDPGLEARFKMKTGRNTPAGEAKQKAAAPEKATAVTSCDKHGCCSRTEHAALKSTPTLGDPGAEARFRLKYGRPSSAEEARIAAAKRESAEPVVVAAATLCDGDCCKHPM